MNFWLAIVTLTDLFIVHAGLMIFVDFESVLGMTGFFIIIEAYLRGNEAQESFIAYQLRRWFY